MQIINQQYKFNPYSTDTFPLLETKNGRKYWVHQISSATKIPQHMSSAENLNVLI